MNLFPPGESANQSNVNQFVGYPLTLKKHCKKYAIPMGILGPFPTFIPGGRENTFNH